MSISGTFNTLTTPRDLMAAVEQFHEPQTWFLNTFFREVQLHSTRHVEIHHSDEDRTLAPFISRSGTGQEVDKKGFEPFLWEPPYMKPRVTIEPRDLQEIAIGENAYMQQNTNKKLIRFRNEQLLKLNRMIERREELMAIQAVYDKSILIVDENNVEIASPINFVRESELESGVTTAWATSATATPIGDIDTKIELITKHTGLSSDIVVLGTTSANELVKTSEFKDYASTSIFDVATLETQRSAQQMGLRLITKIGGLNYYRYDAWYKHPTTGVVTAMIPANKCLIASTGGKQVRHYGAIEIMVGNQKAKRFTKFYDDTDKDPESFGLQMHSAPLPAMHQPNAFAILTTDA